MIPAGFSARAATAADAPDATALFNAFNRHFPGGDSDEETVEDTLGWWSHLDLERGSLLVHEGGRLVAAALTDPHGDHVFLDGYVHPDRFGQGLGSALAAFAEERAASHDPPKVRAGYLADDGRAQRLFAERGYEYVRSFYRMLADLDAPPAEPEWPSGCTLEPGGERDLHTVIGESFAENWGHLHRPFDEWIARVRAEQPDPSLWWVVRCDGEPAAAAICARRFSIGWVGLLGVRPAWRRRGLARGLLLHAFGELYSRGERRIGLGVDATNETGATRLYESVGMRVVLQADMADRTL